MFKSLRPFVTSLTQGLAILAVTLAVPTVAVRLFAAQPVATLTLDDFRTSHANAVKNQRGLVLAFDRQRCGCPDVTAKNVNWNRWPTRCRPENAMLAATNFRPVNDKVGKDGAHYPKIDYPNGAPSQIIVHSQKTIPFPGWPLKKFYGDVKERWTAWSADHAYSYRRIYKKDWGGTPPGKKGLAQTVPGKYAPKTQWQNWQIHHVLERYLGGTNHRQNLVPVYSRPNKLNPNLRTNLHNEFTQWWANIRVDSDCRNMADVWKEIKKCRDNATVWPATNFD